MRALTSWAYSPVRTELVGAVRTAPEAEQDPNVKGEAAEEDVGAAVLQSKAVD
jgi:hypothetical protein